MKMTFQRIDRHNPTLNAIVWQDRERAMAHAKQADEALAKGNASGALHGVPGRSRAGLPAGMQIIAPMWEDGTSTDFAALLSDIAGGFTAPPAFHE